MLHKRTPVYVTYDEAHTGHIGVETPTRSTKEPPLLALYERDYDESPKEKT
tara:strand:- start:6769 stop:6921 length:153 start_codon:yes stop_codon:yes gene_type:complete